MENFDHILSLKEEVLVSSFKGMSPLHLAIDCGFDDERIKQLIRRTPECLIDEIDPEGLTALHRAVYNKRKQVVLALLVKGADPNVLTQGERFYGQNAFNLTKDQKMLKLLKRYGR